jgi:RsiW-degrading membrane proteinase PrsW (M82 family)
MDIPPDQLFIAQTGRSAWRWIVLTFLIGWFSGIVTVALLSVYFGHAHAGQQSSPLSPELSSSISPQ